MPNHTAPKPEAKSQAASKAPDIGDLLRQIILIFVWVFSLPAKIIKSIDKNYLNPLAIIIAGAMISLSILKGGGGGISVASKATTPTTAAAPTNASPRPAPTAKDVPPLSAQDHIRGNKNAQVLAIEYSDLECPFCKQFHPTMKKMLDENSGKVAWVFRHFPLDPIHSKARKEAEAAECAAELGGEDTFWKFVDKIYEVTPSNNGLDPAELPKIASQVGLDQAKFKTCFDSGKWAKKVDDQEQGGVKAGITGTPGTILLNLKTGKTALVPGALPYESLKSQIDTLLSGS